MKSGHADVHRWLTSFSSSLLVCLLYTLRVTLSFFVVPVYSSFRVSFNGTSTVRGGRCCCCLREGSHAVRYPHQQLSPPTMKKFLEV